MATSTSFDDSKATASHSSDTKKPNTSSALEEDTSKSLAATLRLARAKGYIDNNKSQQPAANAQNQNSAKKKKVKLEANSYMIEEKREDRRDHHQNHHHRSGGNRSRGGNQLREVRDSEDYKPEINLEYTDDAGRKLETPKDAFRYMCYKFHGKGPGKNKIDKRLKKQELESKIKRAMSTDVPTSASLMISKQKELQTPFIVLSKGK